MPVGSRILEAAALGLVEVDQDQVFERDHHQPSSAAIAVVKISCGVGRLHPARLSRRPLASSPLVSVGPTVPPPRGTGQQMT